MRSLFRLRLPAAFTAVMGLCAGGMILTVTALRAQDAVPAPVAVAAVSKPDDGLPKTVAPNQFEVLIANSPFTRSLNLSDSLILTGIATMDGKRIATLMNKETKETYVVSDEPNPQGWKMVEVGGSEALETVAAKISVAGGEIVTVRYDEWSLKPGESRPASGTGSEIKEGERRGFGGRGGGDGRPSFGGGPPPEIREKMMTLSEDQRRKLMEHMMKLRTENPEMSQEERGKIFEKSLEKMGKEKEKKK